MFCLSICLSAGEGKGSGGEAKRAGGAFLHFLTPHSNISHPKRNETGRKCGREQRMTCHDPTYSNNPIKARMEKAKKELETARFFIIYFPLVIFK